MIESVFFFCAPLGPAYNTAYDHQIISIGEGLKEIGINFYSNTNYWLESEIRDRYLFNFNDGVNFYDCQVVVLSSQFFGKGKEYGLPEDLFKSTRKYKLVYIDDEDGFRTLAYSIHHKVDIVLKSHYNKKYTYPKNFKPWQFGLTNRIITSTLPRNAEAKKNEILYNFRVHHSTREEARKRILPIIAEYLTPNEATEAFTDNESDLDRLYWHQTGRRHYASYYRRLTESLACACFGGYFQKSLPFQDNRLGYYLRHLDYKFNLFSFNKVYQYDSWRFWESLTAGCCTIHVDLQKYGAVLPVMPENGVHYLGVNFDNPTFLEKQLTKGTDHLKKIGEQGREWALQNYSPKSTAIRFLNLLKMN